MLELFVVSPERERERERERGGETIPSLKTIAPEKKGEGKREAIKSTCREHLLKLRRLNFPLLRRMKVAFVSRGPLLPCARAISRAERDYVSVEARAR